jgi:hypothetical protein
VRSHRVHSLPLVINQCLEQDFCDLWQPLWQQQPPPTQFSYRKAAAVPSAVRLAEGEKLQQIANDVVGQLLRKSVGDATDSYEET